MELKNISDRTEKLPEPFAGFVAAGVGELAYRHREEDIAMFRFRRLFLALLGFIAFASLASGHASATTLSAGSSYLFEDHSSENHSNEFLDGIDLSFGSFEDTNLRNSSLIAGVFVETNFSDANLRNVALQNADLTDAVFSAGTTLRNADLAGAILIGIDLTGVNVQNANFAGAIYDFTTILPFNPVAAGMVAVPEPSPLILILLGLFTMSALNRHEYQNGRFAPAAI